MGVKDVGDGSGDAGAVNKGEDVDIAFTVYGGARFPTVLLLVAVPLVMANDVAEVTTACHANILAEVSSSLEFPQLLGEQFNSFNVGSDTVFRLVLVVKEG